LAGFLFAFFPGQRVSGFVVAVANYAVVFATFVLVTEPCPFGFKALLIG
jgi:hypothetical protein